MIGAFQQVELTPELNNLINQQLPNINQNLNASFTSLQVDNVWSQVVAGNNHFYHLTANDGTKITACIFEPLPHTHQPCQLSLVQAGHTHVRNPHN